MAQSRLNYFTHEVDGSVYGAWYRTVSSNEIEVIGVGMLESGEYGFSPEEAAKGILENFVRLRQRMGAPVPSLSSLERSQDDADEEKTGPPQPQNPRQPRSRM
jgi:hypothetical protein